MRHSIFRDKILPNTLQYEFLVKEILFLYMTVLADCKSYWESQTAVRAEE
jgi:hypothetical protein